MSTESRIRELQRSSAAPLDRTSLGKCSTTVSDVSVDENPAEVENLGFELNIVDGTSAKPVAFKLDGSRFQFGHETVKFFAARQYKIAIKTSPRIRLRDSVLTVECQVTDKDGSKRRLCDAVYMDEAGDSGCLGFWECNLPESGKGERMLLRLRIDVEGFGHVLFPLMVKVYGGRDSSGYHGGLLRTIMFTVKRASNPNNAGTITSTQYIEG